MQRVLIVDDREPNLVLYARVVKQIEGVETQAFASARAALGWADGAGVDLVVVDYHMPEINGIEFITAFRQLRGKGDVPILVITGSSEREIRREALAAGARAFLSKPVDPIEFLTHARNLLSLRASRIQLQDRAQGLAERVRDAEINIASRDMLALLHLRRAMEAKDPISGRHLWLTGQYTEAIGKRAGLSQHDLTLIAAAAGVHDIGKIGIPDQLLVRPGKLEKAEWEIVHRHTEIGHAILHEPQSPLLELAAGIARSHHERWDGGGYPAGLKGVEIPLAARIVAIADTFAALTSARPYRAALSIGHAVDEIERASGLAFEPMLVGAFRESLAELTALRERVLAGERASG